MKNGVTFILVFLALTISSVSAAYVCADGSAISSDTADLDLGQKKTKNGLPIGLVKADDQSVLKRLEADLFIDPQFATLTSAENSTTIIFTDGTEKNVTLVLSTETQANITIGGDTDSVEEGETEIIDGYDVYLINAEGTYPGNPTVKVMVGIDKIELSNIDNPVELLTFDGKKFLVELIAASDFDALIKVKKCGNGSIEINEVADNINTDPPPENNETINNETSQNDTDATGNNTETNATSNNQTDNTNNDSTADINGEEIGISGLARVLTYGGVVVVILIILFLTIRYLKNRAIEKRVKEVEGPSVA